jgi:hypothetical protein
LAEWVVQERQALDELGAALEQRRQLVDAQLPR